MQRWITYLRVSSTKQGASGLGLEAQRVAVAQYIANVGGELLAEYVEIESGKVNDRPVLQEALALCRKLGAVLVIAKLDRLARNVAFISSLMEARTEFIAVDFPAANRLMLHILAAFAEHEREQIGLRTKAALAAAKARGVQLGANGRVLADQAIADAVAFCQPLEGVVREIIADGTSNVRDVAAGLNARGVPARLGGQWWPSNTALLIRRLGVSLGQR